MQAGAHGCDIFARYLISDGSGWKTPDQLRGFRHEIGTAAAHFLKNGLVFGQQPKTFLVAIDKKLRREGAMKNQRCSHLPVGVDLTEPGVMRVGGIGRYSDVIGCTVGPEFSNDPGARLPHYGFAAQVVELENDFGVDGIGKCALHR